MKDNFTMARIREIVKVISRNKRNIFYRLKGEQQMTQKTGFHVAVVGATGAVGQQIIKTLENREFPISQLSLLSSARSAGIKSTSEWD